MIINGKLYGPSPLLKLLAPPGLPPIDYFYCSPLKRWILGCKPFVPSLIKAQNDYDILRRYLYGYYGIPVYNTDKTYTIDPKSCTL